jgi:hypothetical protein
LYRFNKHSGQVLALIVEATIRGQKVPIQKKIAGRVGISQATVSKIISDLCVRKYDNCPYIKKNGHTIELVYENELLRESKKAEILFVIREIANIEGFFSLSELERRLARDSENIQKFKYDVKYIQNAVEEFKVMKIVWWNKTRNTWRLRIPLFEAEKEYLKLVLAANPIWEILPSPRKGETNDMNEL